MSEYPELDRLVDGVRKRSNVAFADLHRLVSADLVAFAHSMLGDRRQAEDAVQQAFLELVRAAPDFRGDGRSLRAWLFRSVRFTCLDELRRRQRRPEVPTDRLPETGSVTLDVEHGPDPALERAMAQLSPRQRSLLVLRHVVGLSGAEIAAATGLSRPAAYAATQRAERRLRRVLEGIESEAVSTSHPLKDSEQPR